MTLKMRYDICAHDVDRPASLFDDSRRSNLVTIGRHPTMNSVNRSFPWQPFGAELVGTALLVAVGLSVVIFDFGRGSPLAQLLPSEAWRRCITGFLFGTTGALITLSPLGKESGAHINPAVTLAFWLMGRMRARHAVGYVICQLTGALIGALTLLAWGTMGRSVAYGATVPGAAYGTLPALLGETVTTFALIFGLFFFLRHRALRAFTPALLPPLYAIMVWLEAPISGTSTNPARSLGPAVISGAWHGWWIYWLGPLLGTLLAIGAYLLAGWERRMIEVAKIYHFDHDPHGLFHVSQRAQRN
jgi:aquaporin Z